MTLIKKANTMKRSIKDFFKNVPNKRSKDNGIEFDGHGTSESEQTTSTCSTESNTPTTTCNTDSNTPTTSTCDTDSNTYNVQSQKRFGPWSKQEGQTIVKELFDESIHLTVHSCFTCPENLCTSVSRSSISKFPSSKKFNHAWLNENWWLCFVEGEGLFCLVCRKHQIKHPQNQRVTFAASPSIRFKTDAINTHKNSGLHSSALETELTQKVSYFHQEVTRKSEVEISVLEGVFSSAFFLMKNFIANRQLIPLLNFIEKIFNVENLKYFQHRSAACQIEIFTTLGEVMRDSLLNDVRNSPAYGILTDEVCDISVTENLITFVQFYNRKTESVCTQFLSCKNILKDFASANSESITEIILNVLKDDNLDILKLAGFSSDGASVMIGKRNGVATRLKVKNPTLINVHCVCHKLALSCADSNDSITYIKTIETILRQLWQLFENSPKKMAVYLKTQTELKRINLGDKASRIIGKRLKKACRTRWLSLEASVSAVYGDYEAILQTLAILDKSGDAAATGLLKRMKSIKFLGSMYILKDILPVLTDLSKHFQKGSLNFSSIKPSISQTTDKLKSLLEEQTPMQNLQTDIDSFTDMCAEIKLSEKELRELQSLFTKYIEALISNIQRRFEDFSNVLSAFGIFDPQSIPFNDGVGFKEYGIAQVKVLAEHFYQEMTEENKAKATEKLISEWQNLKYYINDNLKPIPMDHVQSGKGLTATEWLLLQLLRNRTFEKFYPGIVEIAGKILAVPVTNAWPERGASCLKNIKTKSRNRLSESMMENILHICVNGPEPESEEGQNLVRQAVETWLKAKNRRKLPKNSQILTTNKTLNNQQLQVTLQDAGIQTDDPIMIEAEKTLLEVRHAMKVLELEQYNCESENDFGDTESEDDFDYGDFWCA